MWILRCIPHTRLRRQMHDTLWFVLQKASLYRLAVRQIGGYVCISGVVGKARQPGPLQFDVVVVVKVVKTYDLITTREEPHRDMGADESRGTGNENFHGLPN
jgi:hypothetical protein